MWDREVDVAVIGAGIGGLANAIATVDAGGEVLVVDGAQPLRGPATPAALREGAVATRSRLLPETMDVETNEYFAAVAEGARESAHILDDVDLASVPRRNARNLSREEANSRVVETFVGARLNGWAARCLASPYGLMYTSMRSWPTTKMRSGAESIEVFSIGTMNWTDDCGESALRRWVADESRQRDIEVGADTELQRIVFEEGVVVGVVLDTPNGPCAVRTHAGVTLAPRDQEAVYGNDVDMAQGDRLQVCLVGRTASRFGRVELLATEPAEPRPVCVSSRRPLREALHDARQPSLEGWRCGKVQRYPTFGQ